MSTIIPFSFEAHAVRVITQDAQPWFVLSDVCDVLEIANSRNVIDRLDEDEKGVHTVDTLGGPQEMSIINESGLYNLIFTSRKPEARRFRKWVTGEVLPAIRKTGSYALPISKEDWFNRFARILCLWDAAGETAAQQEWQATGLPCPMPRKHGIRALMEAALDLPAHLLTTSGTGRTVTNRHNGALGGRPRKGETPDQARLRRFHMVEKEITPSPDGSSAVVVTYATHKGA
jgi:prophage antirepressor-like protein